VPAYTCPREGCGTQFRLGWFASLFANKPMCRRCRKGAMFTPADHMRADGTGSMTLMPWTDRTTLLRPQMFGQGRLNQKQISERAARLAPTPEEAEQARQAHVLGLVAKAREGTATITDLVADLPIPDVGGSWSDVDLAEVI
jgi:hypothetical protein